MEKEILDRIVKEGLSFCQEYEYPDTFRGVLMSFYTARATGDLKDKNLPHFINEREVYDYVLKKPDNLGVRLYMPKIEQEFLVEPGLLCGPNPILREEVSRVIIDHLPETLRKIRRAEEPARFCRLDQCERGLVGLVEVGDERMVLKLTNSGRETEIARCLGRRRLGPRVIEATRDVIVEEFIPDPSVRRFAQKPSFLGRRVGRILGAVHEEGVVYDNRVLEHVLASKFPPRTRIIDLEAARWSESSDDFQEDWDIAKSEIVKLYQDKKARDKALASLRLG